MANIIDKEPTHNKLALKDVGFSKFAVFFYKSVKKFYGFSKKNYHNQIIERLVRWDFNNNEKLYKAIYKKLKCL